MQVTLFHSTTAPFTGWWIATTRPSPDRVVTIKVLKDGTNAKSNEDVLRAAVQVLPSITEWHRRDGARCWTAEAEADMPVVQP